MKKLVALIAIIVALAPINQLTHASSPTFDDSADVYERATRMGNVTSTDEAPPPPAPPATPAPTTKPAAPRLGDPLQQVLALTNAERAARGLAPLRIESHLNAAAQGHSQDQAGRGQLTHTGSDGSNPGQRIERAGYRWSTWAENAAAGYGTAGRVVDGWMNSPGHRANILNPDVTELGLGLAHSANGQPYWTQVFGAPG